MEGQQFLNTIGHFRYREYLQTVSLRAYESRLTITLVLSLAAKDYLNLSTRRLSSLSLAPPIIILDTKFRTYSKLKPLLHLLETFRASSTNLESESLSALQVFGAKFHCLPAESKTHSPNVLRERQDSSALVMARIFKKAQLDAQQGTSKSNMLKKFGGKFKKAFLKKKQVCIYLVL